MNFDNLPDGWVMVTLGDIFNHFQYGYTASADKKIKDIKLLRITDIQNQIVNWDTVPGCEISENDFKKYQLENGDFVFARMGSVEKTAMISNVPVAVFASYLIRSKPVISDISLWIEKFLQTSIYLKQIRRISRGTTRDNVNAQLLSTITIPIPPLNEQIRIVAKIEAFQEKINEAKAQLQRVQILLKKLRRIILRKAFKGQLTEKWRAENPNTESAELLLEKIKIERRKKWEDSELEKMKAKGITPKDDKWKDKYKEPEIGKIPAWNQRILYDLPDGWVMVTLENISHRITKGTTPTSVGFNFTDNGILFVKVESLSNQRIIHNLCTFIGTQANDVLSRSQLQENDILFSIAGTLGKVAVVTLDDLPANTNQALAIIRIIQPISTQYIAHLLGSNFLAKVIQREGRGTTLNNLNLKQISEFKIPIPPLAEQEEIVKKVEKIFQFADIVEQKVTESLKNLERLNRKILGKAFRGELVPQDPNDEPASILLERIKAQKVEKPPKKRRKS